MDVIVASSDHEMVSARRFGYPVFSEPTPREASGKIVLRWGNSFAPRYISEINPKHAIATNVNKFAARRMIGSVCRTPKTYEPGSTVEDNMIVIARPTSHSAGYSFRVKIGPVTLGGEEYATQALTPTKEYRVWFDIQRRTMVGRRAPMSDKPEQAAEALKPFPCRSKWGYEWISSPDAPLTTMCKQAADAIGLDMGAGDFLLYDGKYYCLELNSAPSLDHDRLLTFMKHSVEEYRAQY